MEYRRYRADDLEGILALCMAEGWPSFPADPARAGRTLTAPGVTAFVAGEGSDIVGFAQLMSDGEIQAHLSLIAVAKNARRSGVGRMLIERAFEAGGEEKIRAAGRRKQLARNSFFSMRVAL